MKKIIATVLAMVMALALCTTAFAADPTYTGRYDKDSDTKVEGTYTVSTDAATYDREHGNGKVETKTVSNITGVTFVVGTKTDYDVKLTAKGMADLYLKKVADGGKYIAKGTAFTALGDKCGQLNGIKSDEKVFTYTDDSDIAHYYVKLDVDAAGVNANLLVDGALVPINTSADKKADIVDHKWEAASYNKDNTVATFKCKYCGTVATVYDTWDAAKAAGVNTVEKVTIDGKNYVLGYNFTAAGAGSTTTGAKPSPKTFDAGIALYAAMALTSVAGSAVVIGKKKEF